MSFLLLKAKTRDDRLIKDLWRIRGRFEHKEGSDRGGRQGCRLVPGRVSGAIRRGKPWREGVAGGAVAIVAGAVALALAVPAHAARPMFSTLVGMHVAGYQGWFSCPGDVAKLGWRHWFRDNRAAPHDLVVDMWPDTSGFPVEDLCPTGLFLRTGKPAYLFSSENPTVVRGHFQWMKQYGIDGVALQRFESELRHPIPLSHTNLVLANVRSAAEAAGRGFFIMYDLSGEDEHMVERVTNDWNKLTGTMNITTSSSYIWHRGKPVVGLWGLGVQDRPLSSRQAKDLISFFRHATVPATVLGGVPAYWNTLGSDSRHEPEWKEVYRSLDIISPWTVGRFKTLLEGSIFMRDTIPSDMEEAKRFGIDYMPVIFPGMSWYNRWQGKIAFNSTPRDCGHFYLSLGTTAVDEGAKMLYTAMFDEVNEGTAIFKVVAQQADVPSGARLLTLGDGGCHMGSDAYLGLAGRITYLLHQRAADDKRR